MHKENLFKGKRDDNGKWIEGSLIILDSDSDYYFIVPEYKAASTMSAIQIIGCTMELVDKNTICQYINYTDLRNKKVFEHDIVFCEDSGQNGHYGEIIFKDGKYMIDWGESDDLRTDIDFWFTQRRMYVVGNIFDNPELLEDSAEGGNDD